MTNSSYVSEQTYGKSSVFRNKRPLLGRLDMELTERCNNNCVHCYINLPSDDREAKKRELSTREIQEILVEAAALGAFMVRFTGGEPLLREDFEELYLLARKLGLRVMIFTNATLITPELAELFARIPPLEKIEVTVYGMTKNSYEAVTRVPGSYEAFRRGVGLLLEKKIPFVVKGAFLPSNKEEIDEFERWASSIPWMDRPPSYVMNFDLRSRRDSEKKNRLIKRLRLSPEEKLGLLTRREETYVKGMKEFCSRFAHPSGDVLFSCGSGVGGGSVDAYGGFQPCMLLRHPDTVYDLRNGTLKEALTEFFPWVRQTKAQDHDYLARCARCFLKGLCEQCPGKSWMEHGTLDTPVQHLCEHAHAQARFLGLLEEGENAWEVADWKDRIQRFSGNEMTENDKTCLD